MVLRLKMLCRSIKYPATVVIAVVCDLHHGPCEAIMYVLGGHRSQTK